MKARIVAYLVGFLRISFRDVGFFELSVFAKALSFDRASLNFAKTLGLNTPRKNKPKTTEQRKGFTMNLKC